MYSIVTKFKQFDIHFKQSNVNFSACTHPSGVFLLWNFPLRVCIYHTFTSPNPGRVPLLLSHGGNHPNRNGLSLSGRLPPPPSTARRFLLHLPRRPQSLPFLRCGGCGRNANDAKRSRTRAGFTRSQRQHYFPPIWT